MSKIDWTLLARYAAGECTAEERAGVDQWLAVTPEGKGQLAAMREVARFGDRMNSASDRAWIIGQVRRKVEAAAGDVRRVHRPSWQRVRLLRIAAMIVCVLGVAAAGYVLIHRHPAWIAAGTSPYRTFTTPRAGRLSLRLSDGTLVELAPASTLRLPTNYGKRDRQVALVGEASFTVMHDPRRPFAVHAAGLVARDLGTRFVVRAYPDERVTEAVVAEGLVAVMRKSTGGRTASDSIVLKNGDGVRSVDGGRLTVSHGVALDSHFGWTQGRLVFRDVSLSEVAVELGRWYDIDVRLDAPELAALSLNASFERAEAAPAVAQMIADALNLRLVRDGRVYHFHVK